MRVPDPLIPIAPYSTDPNPEQIEGLIRALAKPSGILILQQWR